MLVVKTGRVGQRYADGLDVTMKSGAGIGKLLAPTKAMVFEYKSGTGDQRLAGKYKPLNEAEYTEEDWTKNRVCPMCGEPLVADWCWASEYLPIESVSDDWKAWYLVCDDCGINFSDRDGTLEECQILICYLPSQSAEEVGR